MNGLVHEVRIGVHSPVQRDFGLDTGQDERSGFAKKKLVYALVNPIKEMTQVFILPLAVCGGAECDSLHRPYGGACDCAIAKYMIGYPIIQPDVQIVWRHSSQLQLPLALIGAAEKPNMLLAEGQHEEHLIPANHREQGPDLEVLADRYKFGGRLSQEEIAELIRGSKKS